MATQTAAADVVLTWLAAGVTQQTTSADVVLTWTTTGTVTQTYAYDDVVIDWTSGASVSVLAQTVEPYAAVSVTAVSTQQTVASWAWTQVSGPAVAFTATGPLCQFEAPGLMEQGSIVLKATATYPDGSVAAGQGTVTVLPATEFAARGGQWTARQRYTSW